MKKALVFAGYIFIVILIVFLYFHFNLAARKSELKTSQEVTTFVVGKGEGVKEIAEKLKEQGLIKNKAIFEIYAFLKNAWKKFWPGEYKLNPETGLRDILKILTAQKGPEEEEITIIEGWTNKDIVNYLKEKGVVKEEDFKTAEEEIIKENKYDFLTDKPSEADLQGYLFPDTYRVYKEASAKEIIKKMLDDFGNKLTNEYRDEIKRQGKKIFEVITLASIVEKEAADEIDRRIIAGIFLDRLARGEKLESCTTINYILGESKKKLSYQDTRTPSPYNTYLHEGLPPGPICNPGLGTIKAVIYPLKTDYKYFLSPGDGRTIFSKTYEEHLKNKEKYLGK